MRANHNLAKFNFADGNGVIFNTDKLVYAELIDGKAIFQFDDGSEYSITTPLAFSYIYDRLSETSHE